MSGVLEASSSADWRKPESANVMYLQLAGGQIVFELAPDFAPAHVANIRKLASSNYFDGLAVVRSQDNYVVQWGDPSAGTAEARSFGSAENSMPAEFDREVEGLNFIGIESRDAYADEVGFADGFPAAKSNGDDRAWLTHCYGMLGVGRAESPGSGSGAELYVVTGHSPRHLDRNVTLVGRVISGIEHLTTLSRGTGPLGFYENQNEQVPIESIRFGNTMSPEEQLDIEVLRTDTKTFRDLVEARRYRAEDWFVEPTNAIEICNVPLPVRIIE